MIGERGKRGISKRLEEIIYLEKSRMTEQNTQKESREVISPYKCLTSVFTESFLNKIMKIFEDMLAGDELNIRWWRWRKT